MVATTHRREPRNTPHCGDWPDFMAHARQNFDELLRAGRAGVVTDDVQNLTGQPATPFRTWAEKHADLFA